MTSFDLLASLAATSTAEIPYSTSFFASFCSAAQLTTISQHLEIMFLERNSAVFMQGSKGDYYYILVEGKIHLHSAVSASQEFKARERIKKDPDILQLMTQSKIEEFCGKHNFSISKKYSGFGELALLHSTLAASDSERSLTALIGSSTAILVKLPKEHFDTALKSQHAEKMDLVLKVSFLKNFGVFKDWRTSSLIQLAYLMNIQKSSFGDKITLIDSPLNSVFFVLEGEVNLIRKVKIPRVSKEDKVTYKTHEIGGAGPSSILGDFETIMCGANNCRYKTTSVVKSAFCTTLVFSVNHFEDLVLNGHDEETANTVKANCRALERFRSDRVENYVNKELSAMVQKNAEKKMHGIMEAKVRKKFSRDHGVGVGEGGGTGGGEERRMKVRSFDTVKARRKEQSDFEENSIDDDGGSLFGSIVKKNPKKESFNPYSLPGINMNMGGHEEGGVGVGVGVGVGGRSRLKSSSFTVAENINRQNRQVKRDEAINLGEIKRENRSVRAKFKSKDVLHGVRGGEGLGGGEV